MIRRGGIYWVDFRGALGAEIKKTRPAVVVSTNDHNDHMETVTVVPFNARTGSVWPYEVLIPAGVVGDGRPSKLKAHQVRAVDKSRIGSGIGVLPRRLLSALETTLREHLGIGL